MHNALNRIVKYNIYVLVFLLPLFFLPFSFEAFEYSKQYLLFFLVSLAFFAWLAKQIFYDKEIRFKHSFLDYFVLGFLFIAILSAVFSVDKNSSIFGFYGRFSNGLIGLLSLGALYFLITNNVGVRETDAKQDAKQTRKPITINSLLNYFFCSAGIAVLISYLSIFGVWQRLASLIPLPRLMLQRTFNPTAGSLEGLAVFLAVLAVLLVGLILAQSEKRKAQNIIYYSLLFFSLGLLLSIGFKPAWIVLMVTLILFAGISIVRRLFRENVNLLLIPIFLVIISAAVLIFQPVRMNLPQEQVLSQEISWKTAFKSAADNVKSGFLGTGIGTFHYDFAKYKSESINQTWLWQIRFDRAGSHLAELLANTGFLGLLAYLGLLGFTLLIFWFLISRQFLGLPLAMAFSALTIGQFVYYQNTTLAFAFWLVLGLSVVSWQSKLGALVKERIFSFKAVPELSLVFQTLAIVLGVAILASYFYGVKYYLADVHYSRALFGSLEERTKNLEKAASFNPNLPHYRIILSRAYLAEVLQEMQKLQADQDSGKIQLTVSQSIDQARAATLLQPNHAVNWETLGIVYREIRGLAAGAVEWGVKSFEKAIELEPVNPVLYTELGKLYAVGGDIQKARENFDKAIEMKSNYADALIQKAILLERENILDEAIKELEKAVIDNPFNVEALFQLGRLYFNNNRTDEAIALFRQIVILVPDHSNAHYSLGVAYAAQGKKTLAIQEFEKVLELNPGNPDVMQKLENLRGY